MVVRGDFYLIWFYKVYNGGEGGLLIKFVLFYYFFKKSVQKILVLYDIYWW
jgi:hypothetical protein